MSVGAHSDHELAKRIGKEKKKKKAENDDDDDDDDNDDDDHDHDDAYDAKAEEGRRSRTFDKHPETLTWQVRNNVPRSKSFEFHPPSKHRPSEH